MKRYKRRDLAGFTLVELMVALVVLGIIVAIALPNYTQAQNKARNASVKGNMRTIEVAVEAYATDSGGVYAPDQNGFRPYLPNGGNQIGGANGIRPVNPYDNTSDQALYDAGLTTTQAITDMRKSDPISIGVAGQCGYSQADTGHSYAILGTGGDGKTVSGINGHPLVLSNQ